MNFLVQRIAGRPITIWLRTIDEDVQPQNFGVYKYTA